MSKNEDYYRKKILSIFWYHYLRHDFFDILGCIPATIDWIPFKENEHHHNSTLHNIFQIHGNILTFTPGMFDKRFKNLTFGISKIVRAIELKLGASILSSKAYLRSSIRELLDAKSAHTVIHFHDR